MLKRIIQAIVPPAGSMFKAFVTALGGSLTWLLSRLEVAMIVELMKNQTCQHQQMPHPLELASLVTTPIQFQRNCQRHFQGLKHMRNLNQTTIFFVSQCRITIEVAFGRSVNKWRILKTPLHVRLKNAGKVFMACALLHDFCVNEGECIPIVEPSETDQHSAKHLHSDKSITRQSGTSHARDNSAGEVAAK